MKNFFSSFKGWDWWLIAAVFLLSLFGLAAIYSIDLGRPETNLLNFKKQLVFFCAGLFLMIVSGRLNYTFYRSVSRLLYLFSLGLLAAVLFFGATVRGTKGWFTAAGLSFQPVELMKIGLILLLAFFLSRRARQSHTLNFFLGSAIFVLAPVVLTLGQPDFGSALLLLLIWLSLMIASGTKKTYLAILLVVFGVIFSLSWLFFFKDYQKERFLTFLDPERDPLGRGYNITQSIIAVGSGQWFGRGLGFGSQSQLRFLPETQTDFVFAVIAEELGFVGGTVVICLFALLFWRLIKIILNVRDDFALFTGLGVLFIFLWQFCINIGMNIGLLPVTGLTLPFLSSGGSSLLVNFLLVGIAQSLIRTGALANKTNS